MSDGGDPTDTAVSDLDSVHGSSGSFRGARAAPRFWWRLGVAGTAGAVTLFLVVLSVVGAPVDYRVAMDLLLILFSFGNFFSFGALIGAALSDEQLTGDQRHRRVRAKMNEYHMGRILSAGLVVVLTGASFYVTVVYTSILAVIVADSLVAFGGGFLVGRREARADATNLPKQGLQRLTASFEPFVGLVGAFVGLTIAVVLLFASAYVDTSTPQHAPPVVVNRALDVYGNYVPLGDSYSAGEGLDPIGQCHRSPKYAYGLLLADKEGWPKPTLMACSGAVIGDIFNRQNYGPQVSGPPEPDVRLVTLTIGGDDALFSKVVLDCTEHPTCMWGDFPYTNYEEEAVFNKRPEPMRHVWAPATLQAIADKLGDPRTGLFVQLRRHFPRARIVLLGYPYLFPDGPAPTNVDLLCDVLLRRVDRPGRAEVRYLQDRFNDIIFEEAIRQGVDFINPNLLWSGHEPCGRHGQWINSLETNPIGTYLSRSPIGTGPFHPNAAGQQAFAALISCYLQNNSQAPTPRSFSMPNKWLVPPNALTLADGRPFPREWGTEPIDFNGCIGFPSHSPATPQVGG